MLNSSTRLALRSASRAQLRSPATRRTFASEVPKSGGADSSHVLAGLGGGAVVLGGVYGYYHYSGTAKVVSTARSTIDQAASAKDKLLAASPSPKEAVDALRSFSKTYVAAVPGAGKAIDAAFDQLEAFAEKHGDQVKEITDKTYADLQAALKDGKGSGDKVLKVLQEAATKVQELASEKSEDLLNKLYEKNPELKKVVGSGMEELQKLQDSHGPEAKKLYDDTYNKIFKIASTGGLNVKTYESIKSLIDEKTKEVKELGKKAGSDAWAASSKAAGPLLDQIPDVKKIVDENVSKLESFTGKENVEAIKSLYSELEKIAKSDKSADEKAKAAKKLVESKAGSWKDLQKKAGEAADKAKDAAGSKGQDWAAAAAGVPGLGGLSKLLGGEELSKLKDLAEKHGKDAEKIFESTVADIKSVLEKKVAEVEKLGENVKSDGKKEAKEASKK